VQSVRDRFLSKVMIPRMAHRGLECWVWKAGCSGDGYGAFKVDGHQVSAHRFAWELWHAEEIPSDMQVLHKCDNPICVSPTHLFLGTVADNMADKAAKQRSPLGEKNPKAKLTKQDVLSIRHCAERGIPQKALAKAYGVNILAINRIVRRASWKHV
jgi:hypothetical protein